MKKVLIILLSLGLGFAHGQSQEKMPGDSIPWELRKQSFIYNSAQMFNDPMVARMAIYSLLAENPTNVALYDTLALMYLQYNQNASAALVAQQALNLNSNDRFALEIAGAAFENLGIKDKSLSFFEKLYLLSEDPGVLYKIAFLQYEVKRYTESSTSLDIIINNSASENINMVFPTADGQGQEINLKVAAHRIKAMILEDKGDTEGAKAKYLEVLGMKPGFQVVQQQLRDLTKAGE